MDHVSWITNADELCRILAIPSCSVHTDYPLLVPRPFVDLMERGNPDDPLLLQVLPRTEENQVTEGFAKDPLREMAEMEIIDAEHRVALNKYAGRTLLLATNRCGIHCRFCFRRHFPGKNPDAVAPPDVETLQAPIRHSTATEEIILSGGDPLMLDDNTLDNLLQSILQMKHVRRIRIHSRLPVIVPNRLTSTLAEVLSLPIPLYLVLHINHPHELSNEFLERRELLIKPIVLAQTVLLRSINDSAETLYRLFRRLIDARILPYYLHQLDRVEGAAHFEVSPIEGLRILAELQERLPGYAVPKYVREISGKTCKEIITG